MSVGVSSMGRSNEVCNWLSSLRVVHFRNRGRGAFASYLYDQCFFHGTDAPHSQHFQWSTTEVKPGVQVEVRNSPNTRDIYP